jgi:hypothetical protein
VIYGCPEIVFEYKNDVVVEGYKIIDWRQKRARL